MFDFASLIFTIGVVVSQVQLYSSHDYKPPADQDGVVAVTLHREWYRADGSGKCEFKGVMVPFVRDWDVVQNRDGMDEVVQRAEPGKIAGMAFLVNEKVCEGAEPEKLMRGGEKYRLVAGGNFYKKHTVMASDLLTSPKEQQPRWLIQVFDRLERLAPTDPVAAQFLQVSAREIAFIRGLADGSIVPKDAQGDQPS